MSVYFEWIQYAFMRHALVAILLISPLYALLGTMVIHNRMSFFSDAIGHGALTGIALGVICGLGNPLWAMILFGIIMAVGITIFQHRTRASADMIISIFMSFSVALGIAILSHQGGFQKYSRYLIGDLLSIARHDLIGLFIMFLIVVFLMAIFFNRLLLTSLNASLAHSRGIKPFAMQMIFSILVAWVVTMSIQWVGILVVNALLILPAASARNISRHMTQYLMWAVIFSLLAGFCGLIASYYFSTATGAAIVLCSVFIFVVTLFNTYLTASKGVKKFFF